MIDLNSFFLYKRKKAASSHHNFAHENNKEVWLRGLKRHTANVLNREVPEVDFRLPHSRLGIVRTSSALRSLLIRFESSCFRKTWLVSSVGQSTTLRRPLLRPGAPEACRHRAPHLRSLTPQQPRPLLPRRYSRAHAHTSERDRHVQRCGRTEPGILRMEDGGWKMENGKMKNQLQ